jgi:hypothetical protein
MRLILLAALCLSIGSFLGCSYDRGAYIPPDPYNQHRGDSWFRTQPPPTYPYRTLGSSPEGA